MKSNGLHQRMTFHQGFFAQSDQRKLDSREEKEDFEILGE